MAFPDFLPQFGRVERGKCRDLDPNRPDPIADAPSAVPSAGSIIASCARGSIKASRAWRSFSTSCWSNQDGVSFYSDARLAELLDIRFPHELDGARRELLARDLIAFEGGIYQVLDLPVGPARQAHDSSPRHHTLPSSSSRPRALRTVWPHAASDLESVKQLLERWGRGPQ